MRATKTNAEKSAWSRRYLKALRRHLAQGPESSRRAAHGLGVQAVVLGLEMLDLARIHVQFLTVMPPGGSSLTRRRMGEQARRFFAETVLPIEKTHRAVLSGDARVRQLIRTLRRRKVESSAATRCLKRNICLRQGAERLLKRSGQRHLRLLSELRRLQQRLRGMTHTLLAIQEDERQRMSLHLRDKVAQDLIAIDLQLLILKQSAGARTMTIKKEIDKTQQLVAKYNGKVKRFVHESAIRTKQ